MICVRQDDTTDTKPRLVGFTIPEMLAVIAIIVIIISMLLPAIGKARQHGRAVVCRSNLHQQGIGLIAYTSSTRYYPGAHTSSHNAPKSWIVWAPRVRSFTQGTNADWFWCPDAQKSAQWKVTWGSGLDDQYGYAPDEVRLEWNTPFSYGYNNWGTRDFAIPQWGLGGLSEHKDWGELPKHRVKYPSKMIAIGDAQVDGIWDAFIDSDQPPEFPADRHPGGLAHIVFGDGHVAGITLSDILAPGDIGRWNNDGQPH